MNYRLSAQQRAAHEQGRCYESCPACEQMTDHEPAEVREARDYLTTSDYEEPR